MKKDMKLKRLALEIQPYGIAIIATALSLAAGLSIFLWLGKPTAFILFLPAVMVSAWYGGILSGLVATILSTLAMYYFFITPYDSFAMKSLVTIMQLIAFIFEGLIISYFIDSGHRHERITLYKKQDEEQKKRIHKLEQELTVARKETALRDEFLAIASHELKTPLTTVVLQIQTTLHNIRNVSLSEFSVEHLLKMLQSMHSQTKRLSRMINDLLNISLITTHKMELELEDVDLASLIQDVAESFEEKFEKEGSMITVKIRHDAFGKWDKLRLEQVLDNLISNALKYGNKKPVTVELDKKDNYAIIHIIDQGIGVKNSEKSEIFSLFKRGGIEKDYKGLGIGLYIAQQIMFLHGGKIELRNRPGGGSIFTMYLPL